MKETKKSEKEIKLKKQKQLKMIFTYDATSKTGLQNRKKKHFQN